MEWNSGYTAMETAIIAVYDTGTLTPEVLDKIMEPYKGTNCDSGGSRDIKTIDGLGVKEVICKVMKPLEYEDAMKNPRMFSDFEEHKDIYMANANWKFTANEKAQDVFDSIWNDMWHIWQTNRNIKLNNYRNIKDKPSKNGIYLVEFYNKSMPEYDCIETAWREFKDGEWINPIYNHHNDGYKLIGWCETQL